MGIDMLYLTDFIPWLHHNFNIQFTPDSSMSAVLINVTEVKSYSPVERTPFSIIFRTKQKTEYFPQGLCILQHPEKGDIELFLVPLGFDEEGMRYEAVFA